MLTKEHFHLSNILILLYFTLGFVDIIAEYFSFMPLVLPLRIATPLILIVLYKINAAKSNPLVYTLFILLIVTNSLTLYKESPYFFLAVLICVIQRSVMLVIVLQMMTERKYAYILLAAIPFLLIFYYLNSITAEFALIEFNTLFFQSILVSLLGGISLSGYLKNDNRQNSWLLISTLLFIGLQFVVFIERYFFSVISLRVFGLIGTMLIIFGYFTFYKFVVAAEKHERNHAEAT